VASLEHKKRTPWGFKYLCLSIRIDDIEIVFGVLPLWPLSDKAKVHQKKGDTPLQKGSKEVKYV